MSREVTCVVPRNLSSVCRCSQANRSPFFTRHQALGSQARVSERSSRLGLRSHASFFSLDERDAQPRHFHQHLRSLSSSVRPPPTKFCQKRLEHAKDAQMQKSSSLEQVNALGHPAPLEQCRHRLHPSSNAICSRLGSQTRDSTINGYRVRRGKIL